MPQRKKSSSPEYSINHVELTDYSAAIDASINHHVREPRYYEEDAKVFVFSSNIELEGHFIESDDRAKEKFQFTVYGSESGHDDFELTLADCHVRDEHGSFKYRKARGKELPVYDIPKGMGYIERQRGTKIWVGCIWVKQQTVTDMLCLLPTVRPLFISLHECRVERHRRIIGFTLLTKHPEED